jgi:hypothetical protein
MLRRRKSRRVKLFGQKLRYQGSDLGHPPMDKDKSVARIPGLKSETWGTPSFYVSVPVHVGPSAWLLRLRGW